jgi:WD40 repeat protein
MGGIPRVAREDQTSVEFGGRQIHRGHVKLHVLGRWFFCLIGAVMVAELSFLRRNPAPEDNRMQLSEGEDGGGTNSLAVSPDGLLIATTELNGRVVLRQEAHGWQSEEFADYGDYAMSVVFTPDGRFLVIGGSDFGIALWDRERDGSEQSAPLPLKRVNAMAISPNGRCVAAATYASTQVIIWDLIEQREKLILPSRSPVLSLAFSPDGRYIAAGDRGDRASIYVWDLETGRVHLVLDGSLGPVMAVAFSPDGAMLATTAIYEKVIRVWNMSSGRLCRVIAGHSLGTTSVAFSPDGRVLASAGNDGMVRLWSASTGEPRTVLDGRASRLNQVGFSSNGRNVVATSSGDNHVRFWELTEVIRWTNGRSVRVDRCRIDSGKQASINRRTPEFSPRRIPRSWPS